MAYDQKGKVKQNRHRDKTREKLEKVSRKNIEKFTELKKIISNLSFLYKNVKTLSFEIIESFLLEMARERKIQIVLDDDNIEKQILTDLKKVHQDKNSVAFKV